MSAIYCLLVYVILKLCKFHTIYGNHIIEYVICSIHYIFRKSKLPYIHTPSLLEVDTDTSLKSGVVKLVLWVVTDPLLVN